MHAMFSQHGQSVDGAVHQGEANPGLRAATLTPPGVALITADEQAGCVADAGHIEAW